MIKSEKIKRIKGIVSWYNENKIYGFIKAKGIDYFLHRSRLRYKEEERFLRENVLVEFTPDESEKGKIAEDIIVCSEEE